MTLKRKWISRGALMLFVILAVLAGAFYAISYRRLQSLNTRVASERMVLDTALLNVVRLNKQLAAANLSPSARALPVGIDQPGLLQEFDAASKQAHVVIQSANFAGGTGISGTSQGGTNTSQAASGAVGKNGMMSLVTVNLQVTGQTSGLLDFVHLIQNGSAWATVSALSLSSSASHTGVLSVVFNFPYAPKG